jgi:hypothetical protein
MEDEMRFVKIVGLSLIVAVVGAGTASANDHTAKAKAKSLAVGANTALTLTDVNTSVGKYGSDAQSLGVALTESTFGAGVSHATATGDETHVKTGTKTVAIGGDGGYAASASHGSAESSGGGPNGGASSSD